MALHGMTHAVHCAGSSGGRRAVSQSAAMHERDRLDSGGFASLQSPSLLCLGIDSARLQHSTGPVPLQTVRQHCVTPRMLQAGRSGRTG